MAVLPSDYNKRVYAGWLGKCIGVRFGAPLEGWTYDEIRDNLGELDGYLNEAHGKTFKPDDDTAMPLEVSDGKVENRRGTYTDVKDITACSKKTVYQELPITV